MFSNVTESGAQRPLQRSVEAEQSAPRDRHVESTSSPAVCTETGFSLFATCAPFHHEYVDMDLPLRCRDRSR
jgi:hypothetical protein